MCSIRVLTVDDSPFARWAIARKLRADPEIEVIGTAGDGVEALEKIRLLVPDVVTLDLQLPRMDGLTALRHIMSECPVPVVVVSSLTTANAQPTIEALELGAVDFFAKPSAANPAGSDGSSASLAERVKQAAKVTGLALKPSVKEDSAKCGRKRSTSSISKEVSKVVVIGSSTGGPRALCRLLPDLPADIAAGILIVQHMPPGFTASLARRLDELAQIPVKEAQSGDHVQPGLVLVAPGGFHLRVAPDGEITLDQGPLVCNVRPAIDVTMQSVARAYGADSLGVVLTGMGCDGMRGAEAIKSARGEVIVEDESTCTVYGMPRSVADSGNADKAVPIDAMAGEIANLCAKQVSRA